MTAPQKSEETAIVAVTPASIGSLPAPLQQALELRKLSNQVAGKIAELNWGQKLDLATRRAIADWGQSYGVDPATEVHVLGGNIYLNAAYYLRRLAQLIERGVVEYAYADHIEHDERLDAMGGEGVGEKNRRLRERIAHQVPDKAVSAVVFRVKLTRLTREIVGVKWCGGGTQKNDPVGDSKPVETSESRAARRAVRQIVTHVPVATGEMLRVEDAAESLSERIHTAHADFARAEVVTAIPARHQETIWSATPKDDPYGAPRLTGKTVDERVAAMDAEHYESRPEPQDDEDANSGNLFTPPY